MAVSHDDVKKLAELSRIALSDDEIEKMRSEIDAILSYVDVIQSVTLAEGVSSPHLELENVMREDTNAHEPGVYTEKILAQAPKRENNLIKVKKILG